MILGLEPIAFAPLLLGAGLLLAIFLLAPWHATWARGAAAAICILLSLRYLHWRVTAGVPTDQVPWQQAWSVFFLVFELLSQTSSMFANIFMARFRDRSADADRSAQSRLHDAPVDVFIATYNEPAEILERTIVGARAIAHRDLRVWVLDDGARPAIRALAEELGARYICRVKGRHAKAGNINNALDNLLADNAGRVPRFILLLDADFVPSQNILRRTLGLFEDPRVGIVQTPQHFFNPDPIQSNLLAAGVWPDEQRFFFNLLLPCKDAWGAAFCCGTSAVLRVAALRECGGMATETVTEDMLTSFRMEEYGWTTIFLNEQLSLGLAPEGLQEYVSQRARWCLGAMQQIYTRWGFAGAARLRFISRFSCLDGVLYWCSSFPFKLLMVAAPILYWWTGASVIHATTEDIVFWLLPGVACSIMFMTHYGRLRVLPVMTDVTQLVSAVAIVRTVATGLVKPFGHPFKVTAKGLSSDGYTVQWSFMVPLLALAAATLGGVVYNAFPGAPQFGSPGYGMNVLWSIFNIFVLLLAAAVCVELPKRRREERFVSGERAQVEYPGGRVGTCVVRDISLGGANLDGMEELPAATARLVLNDGALRVPFEVVRGAGGRAAVRFVGDLRHRRALIEKLFTGAYNKEISRVTLPGLARALAGVLVR